MPHILIAGTTGSGKSGCINTILTSIAAARSTPDDVRMILIDPKRIELNYYESIPHLLTPVVSSPRKRRRSLRNVVAEMERRYERLSAVRARNLAEANRSLRSRGERLLPYLLVVIDELADLMMISPQEVEDADHPAGAEVARRRDPPRAGHATSLGGRDHRDDQGRTCPARIAFAVSSQTDSRVILDQAGAGEPARPGRHALQAARHLAVAATSRAPTCGEEEIALVVSSSAAASASRSSTSRCSRCPRPTAEDGDSWRRASSSPDEDPLLDKAIEVVVQTQTASVSLIQRRLRRGLHPGGAPDRHAGRRGCISGYEGSRSPRRVLVGRDSVSHSSPSARNAAKSSHDAPTSGCHQFVLLGRTEAVPACYA